MRVPKKPKQHAAYPLYERSVSVPTDDVGLGSV